MYKLLLSFICLVFIAAYIGFYCLGRATPNLIVEEVRRRTVEKSAQPSSKAVVGTKKVIFAKPKGSTST